MCPKTYAPQLHAIY